MLTRTRFGRYAYALGGNAEAARRAAGAGGGQILLYSIAAPVITGLVLLLAVTVDLVSHSRRPSTQVAAWAARRR